MPILQSDVVTGNVLEKSLLLFGQGTMASGGSADPQVAAVQPLAGRYKATRSYDSPGFNGCTVHDDRTHADEAVVAHTTAMEQHAMAYGHLTADYQTVAAGIEATVMGDV